MLKVIQEIQEILQNIVEERYNIKDSKPLLSPPTNSEHGDLYTNISLQICGQVKKSPMEVAKDIQSSFKENQYIKEVIEDIVVAKPGFINLIFKDSFLAAELKQIDGDFGKNDNGKGKKIMVEFGQPNTHKEMTLGHIKSAITGLSIARLFEFNGYEVIKANYFGDIGMMVAKTVWGLIHLHDSSFDAPNIKDNEREVIEKELFAIKEKEGLIAVAKYFTKAYVFANKRFKEDKESEEEIKEINAKIYEKENTNIYQLYQSTRELSIEYQDYVFEQLGIHYDVQYPETEVFKRGEIIVSENIGKVFVRDKDAVIFPGEKYNLHRWVFLTSQGLPSYSGKELGLAQRKFEDYPDIDFCIITTSVEQIAYFDAVIKALELIKPELKGKYRHVAFGWLLLDGKKTSTRMGKNFSYQDMLSELIEMSKEKMKGKYDYTEKEKDSIAENVALTSLKFGILSHEMHKDVNYNPEEFLNMSGYSGVYILYAYARTQGILSNADIDYQKDIDLSNLQSKEEIRLIRKILQFQYVVEVVLKDYSINLICSYLYELSDLFNNYYATEKILGGDDQKLVQSRLFLIKACEVTLKNGMHILGVTPFERM